MFAQVVEALGGPVRPRPRRPPLRTRTRTPPPNRSRGHTAAITAAEHRQLPAVDGHRTITTYLRATLNWSNTETNRFRSLAQAVDHIDGLGDAWHTGGIDNSRAEQYARLHANPRIRDRLNEFAPILLEHAEQLPHRDFVACTDQFIALADTDGAHHDRDTAVEHRDAHVSNMLIDPVGSPCGERR